MKRKAQAAMEYLMTYGWAILIIIVVAAALYAFGIFNPATWTGTRATGFANIGVPSDWQYNSNGTLQVIIRDGLGSAMTVASVSATCSTSAGSFGVSLYSPAPNTIGAGQTKVYTANETTICDALTAGSSYSVQVKVDYTPQGQTYAKSDTGTITGTTV